ncbi:hypothetical protein Tco_0311754 [Tanacetum coccineum]
MDDPNITIEEYIRLEEEKVRKRGKVYNWETAKYGKICPQRIDEFNLKDETLLSECDEEEHNVLYFNNLFPFNVIYPDDSKSEKDNDDDKIDIEHSLRDLSIKPLPNVIKIDAQWSNKLFETRMPFVFKNLYVPFDIPFDPKLFYKDGIKLGQTVYTAYPETSRYQYGDLAVNEIDFKV